MSETLKHKIERLAEDQISRLREQIGSREAAWSSKNTIHVVDGVEVEVEVRVRLRSREQIHVSDPV